MKPAEARPRQHQHRLHALAQPGAGPVHPCDRRQPGTGRPLEGLNLGVDFVGGQMIRATFAQQVDVEQLRGRVDRLGFGECDDPGSPADRRTYQIRLPKPEGGEAAANRAASQVRAMSPSNIRASRVDAVETVSGKVSEELARDGALSIGLAMLGIAIYIWFRFEWQFGVGALLTLFHDVVDDAWLLRADPASGRPQHRRGVPDHRRLLAERHGRHL